MPGKYPAWIQYSGLPQSLAERTGGSAAWLLFKTMVDMDCRFAEPGRIDISLADLASLTGINEEEVIRLVMLFRQLKLCKSFIPDDEDENLLIEILRPIQTPETHAQVMAKHIAHADVYNHRYCTCAEGRELDTADPVMQEVVDHYLDVCGCNINAFVLDKLKTLRHRASIEAIRQAFRMAAQNETRSLDFVMRQALKVTDKRIRNR